MRITKKLIDRAFELQQLIAPLAAELEDIKTALKRAAADTGGAHVFTGHTALAEVSTTPVTTLDAERVRALLTAEQRQECAKVSARVTARIRPLELRSAA